MLLLCDASSGGGESGRADEQVLKELALPMEEIKRFRQLGSKTPGHPESHITSGRGKHDWTTRSGSRKQRGHGHRWQMAGGEFQFARILKYSTTTCTPCARMVISWRESEAKRRPWPAI